MIAARKKGWLMLLTGLAGYSCFGQTPGSYLPLELMEPPRESHGVRLGIFDVTPSGTLSGSYNDNLNYGSADSKISDFSWSLGGNFTAVAGEWMDDYRTQVSINYSPSYSFYLETSEYNAFTHSLNATISYPLSKLQVSVNQSVSEGSAARFETASRTDNRTYATTLNLSYPLTEKTSLSSNFRYGFSDYSGADQTTGSSYQGYSDFGNDDWIRYQPTEKTGMGLGVSWGKQLQQESSQMYERALFNLSYKVAEKVSASFNAGSEWRQYDAGNSSDPGLIFNISGSWTPVDGTGVSLSANRSSNPSPYGGGDNYTTTGVSLGISQRIRENFSFNSSWSYSHYDGTSSTPSRDDFYLLLNIGFTTMIRERWSLNVFYSRSQNLTGENTGYSFTGNQAGISISWHL